MPQFLRCFRHILWLLLSIHLKPLVNPEMALERTLFYD
jgi:hypothetical protein